MQAAIGDPDASIPVQGGNLERLSREGRWHWCVSARGHQRSVTGPHRNLLLTRNRAI